MPDVIHRTVRALAVGFAGFLFIATSCDASMIVRPPIYFVGGKAVVLDLEVRVWKADGTFSRSDRFASLESEIQNLVSDRVAAAGYEFESDVEYWREADLAYYQRTGQPHYRLNAHLQICPIYSPDGSEVAFAFDVQASLFAQFLDPRTWTERFSDRRLGGAVPSELSARVLAHLSTLLDVIFAPESRYSPSMETRTLLDGRYSVDLVGRGFEDPKELLLGPAQGNTRLDLYREPRSENPLPIASFSIAGLPSKILIDNEARYLVLESRMIRSKFIRRLYEIRRLDGTVIRRVSTDDLLTSRDRMLLSSVPETRIDSQRHALVVTIATCYAGGSAWGFELDCSPGDHVDLEIDLETGQWPLPVRDLLPYIGGQFKLSALDEDLPPDGRYSNARCKSDRGTDDVVSAPRVSFQDDWASSLSLPEYTPIAEKTRTEGRVELALLVEPSGEVDCVLVTKGMPFGLSEASVEAALDWQFQRAPDWDGPRQLRIALEGTLLMRYPSRD